jgi:acetylornithine deacetylase
VTTRFPLDVEALTRALVSIDSRNPSLVPGGPGEGAAAAFLAEVLSGWGFEVRVVEVEPGRPNVVARIGPRGVQPIVLNGHLDVVGVDGMTHAAFEPTLREGSLYARGSSDMKGGIAAMCVAAARAAQEDRLQREVLVAAVCDEEFASIGTRHLLNGGLPVDCHPVAAIVTEPTRLAVVPAHKGFAWFEFSVSGRAAHGSRYDVGIDANRLGARVMQALDEHEREVLSQRTHPLLGRASLHVAMVSGGTGWSTYAEHCVLRVERRTLPGEQTAQVQEEIEALCDRLRREGLDLSLRLECAQPPLDTAMDADIVRALRAACVASDTPDIVDGLWCWTDAALFAAAGIPAVCFGPGDIARAHSATEWVELDQLRAAERVLHAVLTAPI